MSRESDERQARLRRILLDKKRRLWNELREDLFEETGEELSSQYSIPLDPPEAGLIDLLEHMGLALADIRQEELTRMEEAEQKLREGTYGFCDECGKEIDERRLEAVPFAIYCIDCQRKHEMHRYPPPRVTL